MLTLVHLELYTYSTILTSTAQYSTLYVVYLKKITIFLIPLITTELVAADAYLTRYNCNVIYEIFTRMKASSRRPREFSVHSLYSEVPTMHWKPNCCCFKNDFILLTYTSVSVTLSIALSLYCYIHKCKHIPHYDYTT